MNDRTQGTKCLGGATSIINWLSQTTLKANNYSVFSVMMIDNPTDSDIDFYLDTVKSKTRGEAIESFRIGHAFLVTQANSTDSMFN